jgi:hypothetical protein
MTHRTSPSIEKSFSLVILFALLASGSSAQQLEERHGFARFGITPYPGKVEDALSAAASGTTITMASFTKVATKDNKQYTDTIVGTDPFTTTNKTTTIDVLIVPVKVVIGSTTFDPTVEDSCMDSSTPLAALQQSPILVPVVFDGQTTLDGHAQKINGVDVGTVTYPDAVRRAEFWAKVTTNHTVFNVTTAPTVTITDKEVGGQSNVIATHCFNDPNKSNYIGVFQQSYFLPYMQNTVIHNNSDPSKFLLLEMKNVVTSPTTPLNCATFCWVGWHGSQGSPVQTWAYSEYDTTDFWYDHGIVDISVLIHEVGEWLDDPLGINKTPIWGNEGYITGCPNPSYWEVGDPLKTGTDFPAITMTNGFTYHPQELAFYSWFYNSSTDPSLGAGGKFSSNGHYTTPAPICN